MTTFEQVIILQDVINLLLAFLVPAPYESYYRGPLVLTSNILDRLYDLAPVYTLSHFCRFYSDHQQRQKAQQRIKIEMLGDEYIDRRDY